MTSKETVSREPLPVRRLLGQSKGLHGKGVEGVSDTRTTLVSGAAYPLQSCSYFKCHWWHQLYQPQEWAERDCPKKTVFHGKSRASQRDHTCTSKLWSSQHTGAKRTRWRWNGELNKMARNNNPWLQELLAKVVLLWGQWLCTYPWGHIFVYSSGGLGGQLWFWQSLWMYSQPHRRPSASLFIYLLYDWQLAPVWRRQFHSYQAALCVTFLCDSRTLGLLAPEAPQTGEWLWDTERDREIRAKCASHKGIAPPISSNKAPVF